MCFSATGSFAVSAVLTGVGAGSMAKGHDRASRMLALMPLLFAAQQAAEGLVWLTVAAKPDSPLQVAAVNVFLGFALVVWPTWLPVSLFRIEKAPGRRRLLASFVGVGVAVSALGGSLLVYWRPQAYEAGHSIHYDYGVSGGPWSQAAYLLLYILPTVVPFFLSTLGLARAMGSVLLVGLAAALVIKQGALTSAWCFFAAIISVLIVIALHRAPGTSARPQASVA
jgi:hypothetical protein